ncbi:DegV family protein [Peptococcaceae bacterium 1198_IL3148]
MSSIRIVTDSTADLNDELYQQHQIAVVPLKVIFGQQVYKDGVDIKPTQFYERLVTANERATTSQPSPGEFLQTYQRLKEEGVQSIISIHLSSGISGTYRAAQIAQSMLPDQDITVIDSRNVCGGLGLIALAAAKAVEAGKSKEEIILLINEIINKMRVNFLVDTLEYLQRGGRISKTEAFVGSLLNIKPMIVVKDGILQPWAKIRGKNKGIKKIVQQAVEECGNERMVCYLVHAHDPMALEQLKAEATQNLNIDELVICQIGSVIGCHTGPGAVGMAFYKK